jgi:hypothetical protein
MAKAKANVLRTELVKKEMVDEKTYAETWTPTRKRHEMHAWRDYISPEIYVFNKLDADFNIPEIHVMSHWVEQTSQYGALQQYSVERQGQAHRTNLTDGWNISLHKLNYQ